jgi:N-sulfoglucosamine sulfohydrolase
MLGRGYVFDAYPYAKDHNVKFYQRYIIEGEEIPSGWVNDTDFEDMSHLEQTPYKFIFVST